MFPEATKDDLATDEDPVKVHTVFGERRFRMEIQPIYVSSSGAGGDSGSDQPTEASGCLSV